MATKETKLSIVIRTVDKATAKINAITARLEQATRPLRDFSKALSGLREASGLDSVLDGFKGVGSAIGDILGKVAMVGGVVAGAVAGLFHLVDGFDELGDKAESAGVSVDFLASMRYAAERSGAAVEQLDTGLQSLSVNMGMLRAGKGKMLGFLQIVSPALVRQIKLTKSNEEAFDLLARAAAKIEDPAKRAAFAQKTLGDASLAPLLGKGAAGIKELRDRYIELAGSQEGAAKEAGAVDDSMKDLKASTDGIKAALVEGLAPALKVIVDRLRDWLRGHRADIKEWAMWLGERLPGAVSELVSGIQRVVGKVTDFIGSIGGWKTAAIGIAAIIAGPLIGAVASLGVALMSTPVGWAIGLIAGVVALYENWDRVVDAVREYVSLGPMVDRMASLIESGNAAQEAKNNIVEAAARNNSDVMGAFYDGLHGGKANVEGANSSFFAAVTSARSAMEARQTSAKITLDIANAPPGSRVRTDPRSTADVDLSVGYQVWGTP